MISKFNRNCFSTVALSFLDHSINPSYINRPEVLPSLQTEFSRVQELIIMERLSSTPVIESKQTNLEIESKIVFPEYF